jgi:transposase InsO family protein
MELRLQFVLEWHSGFFTMTELCADYRISRKTGYKWVARYDALGDAGLVDQSRRPHAQPQATAAVVVEALLALRRRHPRWGAKKLLRIGQQQAPQLAWPRRSTACDLLKAHGAVPDRRRHPRIVAHPTALAPIPHANATWTTDFKGEFRTGDGRYCYPLTLRDGFSRFVLRCDALLGRTYDATRRCFERAFAEHGLPERMRSDNGGPFASIGLGRLSRLSVWWMRLGIVPERIALGHPEQNGSHEQFHSVLKAETARPPARHLRAQQRRFVRFCHEYNYERPHDALSEDVPASWYTPSPRALPRQLPPLEYPGHCEVRRVGDRGQVSWRVASLFLSEALVGEQVALEEVADGLWTLRFATVTLGRYDERAGTIHPIAPIATGAAPPASLAPRKDPINR